MILDDRFVYQHRRIYITLYNKRNIYLKIKYRENIKEWELELLQLFSKN